MWDKKKMQEMIIQRRKSSGGEIAGAPMKNEIVKDEEGDIDGRHLAAEDMISAFHEKSPERLMKSMMDFIDIHSSKMESEPEPKE